MSRNKNNPSLLAVAVHTLLVLMTAGFWLVPLTIHLMRPWASWFFVLLHTIAVFCTGGVWYICLVIYWMLSKKK